MTQKIQEEILNFHQRIYSEVLDKSVNSDYLDYDQLSARIEDEIFFKYNVEFEEVASFALTPGNDLLNETQINQQKSSTSTLLKMNRSIIM